MLRASSDCSQSRGANSSLPNKWVERTMLGVTSLAVASAARLARRSATPLGPSVGEGGLA
jgi:hypothetical protein